MLKSIPGVIMVNNLFARSLKKKIILQKTPIQEAILKNMIGFLVQCKYILQIQNLLLPWPVQYIVQISSPWPVHIHISKFQFFGLLGQCKNIQSKYQVLGLVGQCKCKVMWPPWLYVFLDLYVQKTYLLRNSYAINLEDVMVNKVLKMSTAVKLCS